MQTPKTSYGNIQMYLYIPFEQWKRYGVSLDDETSNYYYSEEDIFFIKNLNSIEEAESALNEFNANHESALSLSDFHFSQTNYIKF